MNKLLIIFKYNFLSFYNRITRIFFKKKSRVNSTVMISVSIILTLLIYAFIILYMLLFGAMFAGAGMPQGILLMVIVAVSMLSLMSGLVKSNSYLFRIHDYELLKSMPIKNSTIIISKITSLLFSNVGLSVAIGVPGLIIYSIYAKASAIIWLYGMITFIFVPILPLIIGAFAAFISGFIPINKRVKNIVISVVFLALFTVLMFSYMQMGDDPENAQEQMIQMYKKLEKPYFLAPIIILSIINGGKDFILFNGASLFVTILFIIVVSASFNKMRTVLYSISSSKKKSLNKEKDFKTNKQWKTLLKKELISYFSIPSYILNTLIGPIMSIMFVVVMATKIKGFAIQNIQGVELTTGLFVCFIILMMSFAFTMVSSSSAAISIEGKNFWILKSSPINYKVIFASKLFLNYITTIPFLIIDFILGIIFIKTNIYMYIAILIIPGLLIIGTASVGLLLNIYYPKFYYENVQKVIKQGLPVLLTMLISLAVMVLLFIVTIFGSLVSVLFVVTMLFIVSLAYAIISTALLFTKGVKRYERIEF